ncbi:MAG: electron transfer flavoprotein subunit beta/FixA family protein [Gammaproteobacteria bacterium]|nr:electron transfer flavoprotein subunit beta/FixA family protein [Gammaproteobacteria bacterium]
MQKILVCLKRVVDYNVRIRVEADGSGIALEEALRLRERGEAEEIVAVSIGASECQQQLRTGLAMGADRAILVETTTALEPLGAARVLKALVDREKPDLVLLGKQAIDDDNNQTGPMLAALWGRPQATFASEVVLGDGIMTVTREVDAGLEVIEVDLPAVITADLRLNEPRYVKLPDIMKARKKALELIPLQELSIGIEPQFTVRRTAPPPVRQKGIIVKDVAELVQTLTDKGLL